MNLETFLIETFNTEHGYCFRPRLFCKDGFNMSVQASAGHYCIPRKTVDSYESVEIGFPSEEEGIIISYAEDKNSPTQTVYACVPIQLVQDVINKHGGIDVDKTFEKNNF